MIRRPPRSTPLYSSAASDVYKRQIARDTCFLMSSVATVKKHKSTPHVYTSNKLADRRVGWIYYQAYTLALSGKYLESLGRFDEVLRLEPEYIHAWNQKGLCNYFLERYSRAISCFDKASSLNSRYLESLNNKGCALQRLDEFGQQSIALIKWSRYAQVYLRR